MTLDLCLQPRESWLTLASDPIHEGRRPYVWVLCLCGALFVVLLFRWRDSQYRPRSCADCARARVKTARGRGKWRRREPATTFGRHP